MSNNNNKQPLDLTESLLVFDKAQAPSTTRVQSAEASTTTPTVNELDYEGISLVERRSRDVKPREKNDSVGISGINTTPNLSHSDELTIGFLLDCAERGEKRGNKPSPSICKVSRILRDLSESSFIPQLVSIGPIHREDPKLKEFEWQKECCLNDLLNRSDITPKKILEACLLEVNTLIPQIRESYAGVKKNYSDVELARMMVMDGCFILEFCFKMDDGYGWNLLNDMLIDRIAIDLILLENQVPFFVLQVLFDCLAPYIMLFCVLPGKNSILCNVLDKLLPPFKLYHSLSPEKISTTDVDSDSTPDHILGYLHNRYQLVAAKSSKPKLAKASKLVDEEQAKSSNPKHAEASKKPRFFLNAPSPKKLYSSFCIIFRKCTWSNCVMASSLHAKVSKHVDEGRFVVNTYTTFHSIVELYRSGMNFKPHQEDEWSMTIKFQSPLFPCVPWFGSKATLLMPTLIIQDSTELILRNFIAYEQLFPQDHNYFTSYVMAMDMLIDTQEDIAKLVESKVLINLLGSNQEAADMINKICKNVVFKDFCYTEEFKQMDKYYNGFWPKHIAQLRRVYFSNPWSIIALVAAFIVSLATVVATIFAVLDYYR